MVRSDSQKFHLAKSRLFLSAVLLLRMCTHTKYADASPFPVLENDIIMLLDQSCVLHVAEVRPVNVFNLPHSLSCERKMYALVLSPRYSSILERCSRCM